MNRQLFEGTSHSPSLIDLVGYEQAQEMVDFCFIANPYYPTPEMISQLQERLPMLIKYYPSSHVTTYTEHVAQSLGVDPAHLIVGATHLRRDKANHLSSVIPRETRNLLFAGQRFLVSLGMTSSEVSRLKWVAL